MNENSAGSRFTVLAKDCYFSLRGRNANTSNPSGQWESAYPAALAVPGGEKPEFIWQPSGSGEWQRRPCPAVV